MTYIFDRNADNASAAAGAAIAIPRPHYKNNLHGMSAHDLLASLSLGNQPLETQPKPADSGSTANADTVKASTDNNQILAMLTQ
jgi:hypothetical protein